MQVTIGTIAQLFQGIHTPSAAHGAGYLLQPSNLLEPEHRPATRVTISSKLEKVILVVGDVLFIAKGREHRAFLYNGDLHPAVPSSAFTVMRIHQDAGMTPDYLVWILNHPATQKRLAALSKGTAMPALTLPDVAAFCIPLPPVAIQQSIAALARLQQRKAELEAALQQATHLQLQRQLFTLAQQHA